MSPPTLLVFIPKSYPVSIYRAKNLIKSTRGREAISWLLNECKDIACIVVANKKFSLAGKFFEYIFEPVLKTHNSWFYAIGFHNFVANLLYMLSVAKDKRAEYILGKFEKLMRTLDVDDLEQLLTTSEQIIKINDPLGLILTFGICHIDKIKDLSKIKGVSRWALELTTTSLFWMLSF